MESGSRRVFRYSSTHEKEIPDGFIRCRMEIHRAPPASLQRARAAQDPQPSRDPQRRLLPAKERLPVAPTAPRLPQVAHRLLVFQEMATRRCLGEDQPGHPRAPQGPPQKGPSTQRRGGGLTIGEEHRGGRGRAWLRRGQEGEGAQASHPGGHRRLRAPSQGPQRECVGSGGDQGAAAADGGAIPTSLAPVAGRGLPRRGQGRRLGAKDPRLERRARRAPEEARPRRGADGMGEGVGQGGRGGGLAETAAPQGLPGFAEAVGGGTNAILDRPAKEDEQRLREALCEQRSVGVRCHDPPHDEATRPSLRTFHTASEGKFSEVRLNGVLGSTYSPGPTPMSGLSHYRYFLPIIFLGGFGPSVVCLAHRGGVMRLFVESVTMNITNKRKPAKEREACATPPNRK